MPIQTVDAKHPLYLEKEPDWELVRDCMAGERKVKEKGQTYLPATSGMRAMGMNGNQEGLAQYDAYKKRAVFPDLVQPAINALVGTMHREPATILLPPAMEDMRENATLEGESLQCLLRRINEAQLAMGRIGILADVPDGASDPLPYLAIYDAEQITNWDDVRGSDGRLHPSLVVLDESEWKRTSDFAWEYVKKFLVLDLVPTSGVTDQGQDVIRSTTNQSMVYRSRLEVLDQQSRMADADNRQTAVNDGTDAVLNVVTPSLKGRTLDELPFVFIGSIDLSSKPDQIPMLGLANISMTIYRGEADYRHTLYMQGQDTLVVAGDIETGPDGERKKRLIGANASIDLPLGGDAKYIGVSSEGLKEQREALQNDRNRAAELGANLLSSSKGGGKEAEETLKIRVQARTASVMTVVKAGGEGLQTALRHIATWKGLNPEDVIVTPNMDFIQDSFTPSDLVDFMTAKNMGGPISLESIHKWLQDKDVTTLTLEEELALIEEEEPVQAKASPEEEAARREEDLAFFREALNQPGNGGPDKKGTSKEEQDRLAGVSG